MTFKEFLQRLRKKGLKYTFLRVLRRVSSDYLTIPLSYYFQKALIGHAVREINGYKMYLDLKNDTGISKDLYIYRKREHNTTDFILNSDIIKEGDVVLDIGANIGYYALLWAKLVGPKGVVYALEPVSDNFKILEKNIQLNNFHKIRAYRFAAGSKNDKKIINIYQQSNLSSFGEMSEARNKNLLKKREEVTIITVDNFLKGKRTPKLVRMDAEGYESEIIKGMINTLSRTSYLLIELHPTLMNKEQKESTYSILREKGFTQGIVFYEHLKWLTRNGKIKPLIRFVDKKLGEEKIQIKTIKGEKDLYSFSQEQEETPHLLLSKTPIHL